MNWTYDRLEVARDVLATDVGNLSLRLRAAQQQLATALCGCEPEAVRALLTLLIDYWYADIIPCPICGLRSRGDDAGKPHRANCSFGAMLATRGEVT